MKHWKDICFLIVISLCYLSLLLFISIQDSKPVDFDFVENHEQALVRDSTRRQCGLFVGQVLKDLRKTRDANIISSVHPSLAAQYSR